VINFVLNTITPGVRYRVDEVTGLPYTETSPGMLAFTVGLSFFIGVVLLVLGRYGKQMWLVVWSAGLIICSVLYLLWHYVKYIH